MSSKIKKYFVISSIIQIIMGVILIIFAKDIGKYYIGIADIFKGLTDKNSNIISGVFYILANIEILGIVLKKQPYLDEKALEIILEYGLSIFIGLSPINIILSVISIFIILKNPKSNLKNNKLILKSKDLPKLKLLEIKKYKLVIGIFVMFAYLSTEYWWGKIPIIFSTWTDEVILDIIFLIFCIWAFSSPLLSNIKDYVKNFKLYMNYIGSKMIIFAATIVPLTLVVFLITNTTQGLNQEGLEALPYLYVIPSSILWAPLVEEILFRGMLRQIFKNKILFIIISSILFGLMHTAWEPTLLRVFVLGMPYILIGAFSSYLYVKTDNIYLSITFHMILNTFASINMLLGL